MPVAALRIEFNLQREVHPETASLLSSSCLLELSARNDHRAENRQIEPIRVAGKHLSFRIRIRPGAIIGVPSSGPSRVTKALASGQDAFDGVSGSYALELNGPAARGMAVPESDFKNPKSSRTILLCREETHGDSRSEKTERYSVQRLVFRQRRPFPEPGLVKPRDRDVFAPYGRSPADVCILSLSPLLRKLPFASVRRVDRRPPRRLSSLDRLSFRRTVVCVRAHLLFRKCQIALLMA